MTMGVKVYYSEISGSKEVKKRQQRVMMILDSKCIPYEAIDITEAGKEKDKDFMLSNAKPKGDSKIILSPQIFADETYCGDYDDFDLANENDTLEDFLGSPKIEKPASRGPSAEKSTEPKVEAVVTNGNAASRESSAEAESTTKDAENANEAKEGSPVKKASPEKNTKETSPAKSKEPSPEKQVESTIKAEDADENVQSNEAEADTTTSEVSAPQDSDESQAKEEEPAEEAGKEAVADE